MTHNKQKITCKSKDKGPNKRESMDQEGHLKNHIDKFIILNCIH